MASRTITASMEVGQRPDSREIADRRFYGVVIASLLLHVAGFAVLLCAEQHRISDPPRLIMVDMATLPPPEPKAVAVTTPPVPVRPPPRAQAPATTPPPLTSRPVAVLPPVPVAVTGDTHDTRTAPTRPEMTVPVAPAVARRPVESVPSAPVAVQAPSAKPAPADGAEKLAKARVSYRAMIAALIDANKEYPLFARKAGQQGTCNVRCSMMCDGTIKRVELVKSSGYEALDKAGLRAVQKVGKFPPPPTDGACQEVSFDVPITFRLG